MESKFTTAEFACPCECGFGEKEEHIDENLIELLNIVRLMYGQPMVVTSGARCEAYNREQGGVENSAHLPHDLTGQCRAVDILVTNSEDRFDLIEIALKVGFTRFGLAKNFLHLDVAWDLPDSVMFNY
tara:strand:- start:5764 stop:6147 length:384 start_codon:yes stop_codon:yes gene_type:complete